MKCYYDILEVTQTANDDDIRKSYRRLALKWHPDKNLDKGVEAKEQFQLIQQAYEVLSDPQERAWYDKHRDTVLSGKGSDYKDDSLNVYEFFTTACFSGYNDDPTGFYSVYSEVFKKIAAEDSEFDKNLDSDFEIPEFGNSNSSYEEVVHPFYAYWMSYSTKKTYAWLDEYDIREAPNRRILRLMEKENKKIREKARKERNEEVRALVAFVRKRDKRVIEHIKKLEEEALEKEKRSQELRRQQILKRQNEMKSYVESDWSKFSNLESELKEIEANLDAEFQDDDDGDGSSEDDELYNNLFCPACSKLFKTAKAFSNHENSKKHRENVEALRAQILEDEDSPESETENDDWKKELLSHNTASGTNNLESGHTDDFKSSAPSVVEDSEMEIIKPKKKKKQKQKKRNLRPPDSDLSDDSTNKNNSLNIDQETLSPAVEKRQTTAAEDNESDITENEISDSMQEEPKGGKVKTEKKKKMKQKKSIDLDETEVGLLKLENSGKRRNRKYEELDDDDDLTKKSKKKNRKKDAKTKNKPEVKPETLEVNEEESMGNTEPKANPTCEVCNSEFNSKNELFKHLKNTGHAVAKAKEIPNSLKDSKTKKSKK